MRIGEYLESNDDWERLQPLPQERVSFDTVLWGDDKLAFIGGQYKGITMGPNILITQVGYTDEVTIWNMRRRRWSTYYLELPRRRPASVAWGPDRLVVCGGYSRGFHLNSCEVVSTTGGSDEEWKIPDMMHTRDSGRAVLYKERYMIVMGGEGDHDGDTVEVLDLHRIGEDTPAVWSPLPSMTLPRDYFSAVVVEDTLVVAGRTGMEILELREFFDGDGVVAMNADDHHAGFKVVARLPTEMAFMGMVAVPMRSDTEDESDPDPGVTFLLANGNKENGVYALEVPSFKSFTTATVQDIEEGGSQENSGGIWHELPTLSVPCWRVDLVLVGDSLLAVGDTWIERLKLSTSKESTKKAAILEPLDYRIPKNWIRSLLYRPQSGTHVTSITFGAGGMHFDNGGDPRIRNAIISIVIVYFFFFRHWRPQFGGGQDGGGRPLGRS